MSVNGTLVEYKMRRFKGECERFSFNKCPIYTHDGASAKFKSNSHETDNSVLKIQRRESLGLSCTAVLPVQCTAGTATPIDLLLLPIYTLQPLLLPFLRSSVLAVATSFSVACQAYFSHNSD